MRTTVDISTELLRRAKKKALEEGTTLRGVVEAALNLYLRRQAPRTGYELHWGTERGRIQPGVRLDDRDSLFDVMDGRP